MKKSISEHTKRIRSATKKQEVAKASPKEESDKTPGRGRSSINSIPMPTLQDVYTTTLLKAEAELEASVKKEEEPKKEANLSDELCNAFRFVVNYGVFEPNFEWLPHELLIHIFQYLNTRDLLEAGQVCRQWMEATQYFRLCRKILLHFQIFKYSDTAYPINRFLSCSRFFPNIKFSIVKFSPKNDAFWELYGEMVEQLTFNSCLINKPEFLRIIRLCPGLTMLSITRCDDLYKTWSVVKKTNHVKEKLPEMKWLKIHETSLLNKDIFNFMVASMPNLTALTIANCFGNSKPKDRADILNAIIDFLSKRSEHIKVLNLVYTQTDDLFLEKLAEIKGLRLDELRLTFNGVVTTLGKCGILMLIRNQKYLKTLDLTDSKSLSNLCLMEICKHISQLKKLILNKCWLINDVGLREVHRLLHLEVLDITSCDRVTDLGLLEGLIPQGKKFFRLKELYLGLLPYMSILAVYRLSQQYDELQVLDLSGSSNSITDETLQMIFRYQLKLKHLNLDCCAKITDTGMTGLSDHDELGNCQNYVPYTINNLKDLQYLNITGCYQISDKSLLKSFDLPELKEINMSRCHNCTEIGIKALCKKCPLLEVIDLSECFHVKDSTVEILTKHLIRLETLKLNGCEQITDAILDDIADNCKYLKSLYIRRCPKMQTNPFEILKHVRYIHNQ